MGGSTATRGVLVDNRGRNWSSSGFFGLCCGISVIEVVFPSFSTACESAKISAARPSERLLSGSPFPVRAVPAAGGRQGGWQGGWCATTFP
jgi:hypothetical protein